MRPVAAPVLDAMRRRGGVATTAQIMADTGLSRRAVEASVRRANSSHHVVVNTRRRGLLARYWLQHDHDHPGERRCAVEGCRTLLSASNETHWCRRHLPAVALLVLIESTLDAEGGEENAPLQLIAAI